MPDFGAIVLVPFPFTDLSAAKVRPALVVSRSDRSSRDVIVCFMTGRAELEAELPRLRSAMAPACRLWIAWPKRAARVPTDLSRDTGWDPLHQAGRGPVAATSIDEVWSGLRFGLRPDLAG